MLSDWELWACAKHYLEKHGEDAPSIAATRADELLADGDFEGSRNLRVIVRRINQMLEAPAGPLN